MGVLKLAKRTGDTSSASWAWVEVPNWNISRNFSAVGTIRDLPKSFSWNRYKLEDNEMSGVL